MTALRLQSRSEASSATRALEAPLSLRASSNVGFSRMEMTDPAALDPGFPHFLLGPRFGQWWRIHSAEYGPWWFASSDTAGRDEHSIGRFDLPSPNGTCYVGNYLDAVATEVLRETGVAEKEAQEAATKRQLSQMPLDRWYGAKIADFTSGVTRRFGAPEDVGILERAEARAWASAAYAGDFRGILYRLGEDPRRRLGLALFHHAGAQAPPNQPPGQPLPVGLRGELTDLFDGEYRDDPVPK